VPIHVGLAGPPHRDQPVAEFHVRRGGTIEIPAELFRVGDRTWIALYSRAEGVAWEYPLDEFTQAIAEGIQLLAPPDTDAGGG
jgi:hypothetical protein